MGIFIAILVVIAILILVIRGSKKARYNRSHCGQCGTQYTLKDIRLEYIGTPVDSENNPRIGYSAYWAHRTCHNCRAQAPKIKVETSNETIEAGCKRRITIEEIIRNNFDLAEGDYTGAPVQKPQNSDIATPPPVKKPVDIPPSSDASTPFSPKKAPEILPKTKETSLPSEEEASTNETNEAVVEETEEETEEQKEYQKVIDSLNTILNRFQKNDKEAIGFPAKEVNAALRLFEMAELAAKVLDVEGVYTDQLNALLQELNSVNQSEVGMMGLNAKARYYTFRALVILAYLLDPEKRARENIDGICNTLDEELQNNRGGFQGECFILCNRTGDLMEMIVLLIALSDAVANSPTWEGVDTYKACMECIEKSQEKYNRRMKTAEANGASRAFEAMGYLCNTITTGISFADLPNLYLKKVDENLDRYTEKIGRTNIAVQLTAYETSLLVEEFGYLVLALADTFVYPNVY